MKNITLVAIDFQTHELTKFGIEQTLDHIDAKEVLIISDREILPGAKHVIREPVNGMTEYNKVMLKGVAEHINTDHTIYVQWDGMAHDKSAWTDDFLKYDYIGAPWPWEAEGRNIGNGGFSLRSRRLLDACLDEVVEIQEVDGNRLFNEDDLIGKQHRAYFESKYNLVYPDTETAYRFSFELGQYRPSFGFHGAWNIFHFLDDRSMDFYAEKMGYTGWNMYKWHHVLAATIRRGRMDLYEMMLGKLIENNPEFLTVISQWIERGIQLNRTELIID